MQAKIVDTYIYLDNFHNSKEAKKHSDNFRNFLDENKGKFVDIETKFIFDNQYNCKGFRLYDTMISEIKNDVRTDENIFFVKHPKGKDKIKKIDFKDWKTKRRFYGCSSVNGNYYRISRRSNLEFILVGSEVYMTNSIGYTPLKKSMLSDNEKKIILECRDVILKS